MSWKSLAGIAPRRTIRVLNTIHSFPEKVFIGLGSGRGQALSMANENKPRVAIVDDDPLIVESFADEFSEEFQVLEFTSPLKASELSALRQMDVIIADYRMPELDGITFLEKVKLFRPNLTRILFTAYADLGCLSRAINQASIFHYIAKDSLRSTGETLRDNQHHTSWGRFDEPP